MIKFSNSDEILNNMLNKGAFLVAGSDPKNVMTISWGFIGVMWYKPVMIVPVRTSRWTKQFIDGTGEFTVSVPVDKMQKELTFCGTKSGRDTDKFKETGLVPKPAKKVKSSVVGGCDRYYECKVVCKLPLTSDMLPEEIKKAAYGNNDYHTLYIGEIFAEY